MIEVPWDIAANPWELLSIHHEVGHSLEADLKLQDALDGALTDLLTKSGEADRIAVWKSWRAETFADHVALRSRGQRMRSGSSARSCFSAADIKQFNPRDPHPTP